MNSYKSSSIIVKRQPVQAFTCRAVSFSLYSLFLYTACFFTISSAFRTGGNRSTTMVTAASAKI